MFESVIAPVKKDSVFITCQCLLGAVPVTCSLALRHVDNILNGDNLIHLILLNLFSPTSPWCKLLHLSQRHRSNIVWKEMSSCSSVQPQRSRKERISRRSQPGLASRPPWWQTVFMFARVSIQIPWKWQVFTSGATLLKPGCPAPPTRLPPTLPHDKSL